MGTTPLFEVADDCVFGVARALRWQIGALGDLRRWVDDRALDPGAGLLADYQRVHHGLADFDDVFGAATRDVDPTFPKAIVDTLVADCAEHPHGASMVADRATIGIVGNGALLAPLYVDQTRELLVPSWFTPETATTLFTPTGEFRHTRRTCTTWLILDAPVYRDEGRDFATFAYFFTREGTDPGARWHWRSNEGRA